MNSTTRRLMLGTAFTIAGIGVALGCQSAAHADDKPPAAVQQPRGTLDAVVQLPDQASDTAQAAVAKATKPAKPPKAKPSKDPKHEPTTEPEPPIVKPPPVHTPAPTPHPQDPPQEEPADGPVVALPPVELPPIVIDPPPVVVPTPQPSNEPADQAPTLPLPALPLPAVPALPVDLPAPIGAASAALATGTPPSDTIAALIGTLTAAADQPADCHADPDDARRINRDALRALLSGLDPPPATTDQAQPAQPCPGHPGTPDGPAITALAVKPPPPDGQQLVADNVAGAYTSPVLHRLTQLRARSHTLTGRAEHIEPNPA